MVHSSLSLKPGRLQWGVLVYISFVVEEIVVLIEGRDVTGGG